MKNIFISLLLVIGFSSFSASAQQNKRCDAHCISSVKWLIRDSKMLSGGFTSWSGKYGNRLGDRVSVGILKVYKMGELAKPGNIKILLPVIREGFSYPSAIKKEEDKTPTVSLYLLRYLESKAKDGSLKKEISGSINFILEKTENTSQQPDSN